MSLHEKIVSIALLSCVDFQMILLLLFIRSLKKKNQFLNKAESNFLIRVVQKQKVGFPEAYVCFACKCRS